MNKHEFEATLDGACWSFAAMQAEGEVPTEPGLYERHEKDFAWACKRLVDDRASQATRIDELEESERYWKTAHADLLRVLAHVREAIQRGLYAVAAKLVEPYVAWDDDEAEVTE
jgi:hypothetical protein